MYLIACTIACSKVNKLKFSSNGVKSNLFLFPLESNHKKVVLVIVWLKCSSCMSTVERKLSKCNSTFFCVTATIKWHETHKRLTYLSQTKIFYTTEAMVGDSWNAPVVARLIRDNFFHSSLTNTRIRRVPNCFGKPSSHLTWTLMVCS